MAHNYDGDATGIVPGTVIRITEPDDGDADNVASVNPTAFQKLANFIKFLFTFVPFLGGASGGTTFTNTGPDGGTALTIAGGAGGSGNSTGLDASHHGTGAAVNALSPSNTGGAALRANATKAAHDGLALDILDGLIKFSGGAAPAAAVALLNAITAKSFIKGWAIVHTDGAGGITLIDGQNVGAVAIVNGGAGQFAGKGLAKVTWAQPFASVNYGVLPFVWPNFGTAFGVLLPVNVLNTANDSSVGLYDTGAAAGIDLNAAAWGVLIVAIGAQ